MTRAFRRSSQNITVPLFENAVVQEGVLEIVDTPRWRSLVGLS